MGVLLATTTFGAAREGHRPERREQDNAEQAEPEQLALASAARGQGASLAALAGGHEW